MKNKEDHQTQNVHPIKPSLIKIITDVKGRLSKPPADDSGAFWDFGYPGSNANAESKEKDEGR